MNIQELQKDKTIVEWFDTIKPSEGTIKAYLSALQSYTEFTEKTPEELISEAEQDISAGVLPRRRSIKRYLNEFHNHLQDNELADKTIHRLMSAVRSFYTSFDIDIPKLAKAEHAITVKEENLPIPTKSDLQDVLKVCEPLEKAIVLVGASSGLSTNEIIRLTVKQFKDGYDPETKVTTLPLRRAKVKFDFITFLSPEASQAVWDYLAYRNRETKDNREKRINQLEKQKIYVDNNFLFCKTNISNDFLKSKNDKERQLTNDIIMKIYRTISEKAGKNSSGGNWNVMRSHNMRRYFNSTLLNAGCDSFHVNFWMGHKQDATQAAYFRASPEKLRELYLKYVPFLTIQKEADVSESAEYLRIKQENQILQAETARHVVERSELQVIRAELEQTKVEKEALTTKMNGMKEEIREELSVELKEMTKNYLRVKKKIWRQNNPVIMLDPDFEEQMDTKSIDEKHGSEPVK
jgi:integrase